MGAIHLTKDSFNEAISKGRVLVDFWAGWCMPCKMVAPVIEELAVKYEGSATVAKVDVDRETVLAGRFDIVSIPTVIVFQDGQEVKRLIGVQSREKYESLLTG